MIFTLLDLKPDIPIVGGADHVASMDDPLVITSLLPPSAPLDARLEMDNVCN